MDYGDNEVLRMLEGMSRDELLGALRSYEAERERLNERAAIAENLVIEINNELYDKMSEGLQSQVDELIEYIIEDRKGLMDSGDDQSDNAGGFDEGSVSFT